MDLVCLWHIQRKIRSVRCFCLKNQVAKGVSDRYYSNEHTSLYCFFALGLLTTREEQDAVTQTIHWVCVYATVLMSKSFD